MKFCESCGVQIEALKTCTQCGASLTPNVRFCEACGAPVSKATALVNVVQEEVLPASEQAPASEFRPPAESAVNGEEKPVPAPVKKPAPAHADEKESPIQEKVRQGPKDIGLKKGIPPQTMIIAVVIILAVLGAAVYFVGLPILSGSGTPTQNPTVSPFPTNSGSASGTSSATEVPKAASSQAETISLTPGPTQVPPNNRALTMDVERDAISHIITVTFQGGEGQYGVSEILVTLTKSDGTIETKSFKPEYRGIFTTLQGTEKTDRVEITANFYNGESYKIVDQVFEYKKRTGSI